ncbi:TPA: phosphotransferase [Legionella pneumophila]|uniref:phosphotransferase n=1 Tax=Legionella pneumophila TaxID=446 RepID=UPI00077798CF|nr:phosphotransferase [Legionella pneumophila]HAT8648937.1 phosphotransferase [Legionella pneumophila]
MKVITDKRLELVPNIIKSVFNLTWDGELFELNGGGSSSAIYKFKINNIRYVLRLMGLDAPIKDRLTQIICAKEAASINLGPQCYYSDAEQGIVIMEYIESQTLSKEIVLKEMPSLLSKMHSKTQFPEPFCIIFPYMKDFITNICNAVPSEEIIEYLTSILKLMEFLNEHRELASCHNDLNTENVLFDGTRIVLIDFEAAGEEDPYFDLATVCQQNNFNEKEEYHFLSSYLERDPTHYQLAKLYLMKQVSYCFHVVHFLDHAYKAGIKEFNDPVPTFNEWYKGRKEGSYRLDTPRDWMLYALAVMNQSFRDMSEPQYLEAKNVMADQLAIKNSRVLWN